MEKILLCVLLATESAFAFEGRRFSANFKLPSSSRLTNMLPRRGGLIQENTDNRVNELENKVEKLLDDHRSKDIRHRAMEAALANLVLESTVDCGPPPPADGADVVFTSTGLNAMASYKCKEGFFNILPGKQMISFCQNDGQWSMVSVKCADKSKDKRVNDLENKVDKLLNDKKNKDIRIRDIETALANLTSELNVDCGSPTPPEGTDVDYSSTGLYAIANYRCKKGFLNTHPGQQMKSFCQKDGHWTINMKCPNISVCWTAPAGVAFYTGTRSTTITGKACQRWDAQTPHTHVNNVNMKFSIPGFDTPQTVTGSANYCRDPSYAGFLWCYTTNRNSRWEKCDVPKCNP
ncbi:uncharacterized protein LOC124279187 isoform X2 [Haliotis rubra]|uniref:uncharacterized protein LOC124279187 isoform X2 n=1 Tax=Haliotis rubra TaxID=36100 RepID=UPI001EE51B50|nr:uncharacterized protein LOC124279187 isoform X2 [Haliotis rubra]